MTGIASRLIDARLIRYGLVSLCALAVDMGLFLALLAGGFWAAPASAIGYCAGIAAHWWLSTRAVFVGKVARPGAGRSRQKALFVASALVGLGVTTGIVWAGDKAGFDPRAAKLAAIAVSFTITWLIRSRMVFR